MAKIMKYHNLETDVFSKSIPITLDQKFFVCFLFSQTFSVDNKLAK